MKRKRILLISACVSICLIMTACRYFSASDTFDADSEGILQVNTREWVSPQDDNEEPELKDFVIAGQGRIQACDPFVADEMTVYNVPDGCFVSYIDRDQNKVLNRLNGISVTDAEGNFCEIPEIMNVIFPQIAQLEHDLMAIKILSVGDEWFVYVELNANWWTPCDIYYFHPSENKLIRLCEFDHRQVLSLHILSEERLHALR